MKKSLLFLAILFTLSFVSCTDNLTEDEQINETLATGHGEVGDDGDDDDEEEVGG